MPWLDPLLLFQEVCREEWEGATFNALVYAVDTNRRKKKGSTGKAKILRGRRSGRDRKKPSAKTICVTRKEKKKKKKSEKELSRILP